MSSQRSEKITCPGCGKEHDFEMWNSLNTMLDPDMKEKLLSKEMFQFICSAHCGIFTELRASQSGAEDTAPGDVIRHMDRHRISGCYTGGDDILRRFTQYEAYTADRSCHSFHSRPEADIVMKTGYTPLCLPQSCGMCRGVCAHICPEMARHRAGEVLSCS